MVLWHPTCRNLTFNRWGASTTRQWSSSRTAGKSGTASTSPTTILPQRSSARVVKSRGELPPRNTPRANGAAVALNRWGVRDGELTSLADRPNQYLLGALVLKLETSCCTRALPHLGHFGGRFFRRSCSLIGRLTSKCLPTRLALELVDSHVFPPPTSAHDPQRSRRQAPRPRKALGRATSLYQSDA